MKLSWRVLLVTAAAAALAALLQSRPGREPRALKATHRALLQQGFKTDLSEFSFTTPDELRAREAAWTNAGAFKVPGSHLNTALLFYLQNLRPDLLQTVGSNSAFPVWKQDRWPVLAGTAAAAYLRQAGQSADDLWPALREAFDAKREALDAACVAALAGPIRFHLIASHGNAMLLPHLASMKHLTQSLGGRAMLELHDGNQDAAWTNLLVSTRLVTAWSPEPVEVSHHTRHTCASIVYSTTWQALQADHWSDARLALLQHEWEMEVPCRSAECRGSRMVGAMPP